MTRVTALASALTGRPVRRDIAMTGEISLRGRVLPIGGRKEKTLAAYRAQIDTVLIPRENERDLAEIDSEARENLKFILCDNAWDVLSAVLLPIPQKEKQEEAVCIAPFAVHSHTSVGTGTAT